MTETNNFLSSTVNNTSDSLFEEELSDTFKIEDVFSLEASTSEMVFVKEEPLSEEEEDSKQFWYEDLSAVKCESKPRKNKKCRKCLTLFTNRWSFNQHIKYCSNRFQCSECRKRFWNSYLFKCHKWRAHSCMSEQRLRYCQQCELPFRWKHQLLFHVIQHSPQSCESCGSNCQAVCDCLSRYTR